MKWRRTNKAAELSGFMTGLGLDDNATDDDTDPIGRLWVNDLGPNPEPQRGFNDAFFRASSLEDLVFNSPCIKLPNIPFELTATVQILQRRPLNMSH